MAYTIEQFDKVVKDMKAGKDAYVTFGTWDSKPIEWLCVKLWDGREDRVLLVSRGSFFEDCCEYDSRYYEWRRSHIHYRLNGEVFDSAFSDEEKKHILNVYLSDVDSKDDVFLLSRDEADRRVKNRIGATSSSRWWLRDRYSDRYVYNAYDNDFDYNAPSGRRPIRPAIWLKK